MRAIKDIVLSVIGMFGAVVGLGTAWVGFKGKHEETLASVLQGIRKDNQDLKEYNRQILQDNKILSEQVKQLMLLVKDMNLELKNHGKDYSEQIDEIVEVD